MAHQEMSCCNGLSSSGAKKAFICKECSGDRVVLCEDCSILCHALHEPSQIVFAKNQTFSCDCGNNRAEKTREICLLRREKPLVNLDDRYDLRLVSVDERDEYYERVAELLARAGPLFINRASVLAEKGCFIEVFKSVFFSSLDFRFIFTMTLLVFADALKDIDKAMTYDVKSVIEKIKDIDLGVAGPFLLEVTTKWIKEIESENAVNIMSVAELDDIFFKRVESTLEKALEGSNGENPGCLKLKVKLLAGALKTCKDEVMDAVWPKAISARLLNITSFCQFELYKKFVLHRSVQKAVLNFKKENFRAEDWETVLDGHGGDYEVLELMPKASKRRKRKYRQLRKLKNAAS